MILRGTMTKQEQRHSSIKEKYLFQVSVEITICFCLRKCLLSFNMLKACKICASKTCQTKHHGLITVT